ncbi:MAG: response regulator transcription factor [Acutalibacteraceae bacterium]
MRKILVAEDESSIRELIAINLSRQGYEVYQASDGKQAIELFDKYKNEFAVVILDIMMPVCDGTQVCRHIRETDSTTGIIFLSAKTQETDKIYGLLSGADDYITKPFSVGEMIARIEAVCRRVEQSRNASGSEMNDETSLGEFTLSAKKRSLFKNGEKIELSQIEFEILYCLFSNAGKVIDRKNILETVWGDNFYGDEKVVDVNIRRLRLKVEDDASCPKHLLTVWGKGYKWIG